MFNNDDLDLLFVCKGAPTVISLDTRSVAFLNTEVITYMSKVCVMSNMLFYLQPQQDNINKLVLCEKHKMK